MLLKFVKTSLINRDMNSGIYEIYNRVTGIRYIGSTLNFKRRWLQHRVKLRRNKHTNLHLQNSWNKHGEQNFEFKIYQFVEPVQEWLDLCEQNAINSIVLSNLYNVRIVSRNNKGLKHSQETKEKLRNLHLGTKHTEETKRKISEALKGRKMTLGYKHSDEMKRRVSETLKGNSRAKGSKRTDAQKKALAARMIGNKYRKGI
jgi:group I intron endonuclease